MSQKISHLEMIQGVINRMAQNSFALKGWAVAYMVGVLVLPAQELAKNNTWFLFVPFMMFWLLDAYYLMQERLYRKLYNRVSSANKNDIDFSMSVQGEADVCEFVSALFSFTQLFYIPFAIILLYLYII